MGGIKAQRDNPYSAAMASHRGMDYGQHGGSRREHNNVIEIPSAPQSSMQFVATPAPVPIGDTDHHIASSQFSQQTSEYGEIRSHVIISVTYNRGYCALQRPRGPEIPPSNAE